MGKTADRKAKITGFVSRLTGYKKVIDTDIARYAKYIQNSTLQNFGAHSRIATDAYLSVLQRGGKRIRGALTMVGYEMSGGKNHAMVVQAARAIEMLHAYILIIDDINDRSVMRRGGPAAHVLLADYHRRHSLGQDAAHFGESVAMNAALAGAHAAQMIISNLDVDEDARLKALSVLNRSLVVTSHGQVNDIFNEVATEVTEQDVERVLEWKTAHYTFLNPLHFGMILAGAGCEVTDAITEYAMHAGKAFQITDDIIGTFGEEFESGKSPMDDIKEGKRTILAVYALKHASNADKNFLLPMLGNQALTPAEFQRCKDILVECGALAYAQQQAKKHIQEALKALERESHHWSDEGIQFLKGLATYLVTRQA